MWKHSEHLVGTGGAQTKHAGFGALETLPSSPGSVLPNSQKLHIVQNCEREEAALKMGFVDTYRNDEVRCGFRIRSHHSQSE